MSNLEIYKNANLSSEEMYVINNEFEKITALNLDELNENVMIDKMFLRGCEQNNINVIKYLLPYLDDECYIQKSMYACLYFKYIDSGRYLYKNLFVNEQMVNGLIKYFNSIHILEVFFILDNHESIEFLLEFLYDWTTYNSCVNYDFNPYPILVGVKKNSYKSVKVFLDCVIKKNDIKTLEKFYNLATHHAFHTACEKNYIDMAKYFTEINPNYKITKIENNIIIDHRIDKPKILKK